MSMTVQYACKLGTPHIVMVIVVNRLDTSV